MQLRSLALLCLTLSSCAAAPTSLPAPEIPVDKTSRAAASTKGPLIPFAQFKSVGLTDESVSDANLWLWKSANGNMVGLFRAYDTNTDSRAESTLDAVEMDGQNISFDYRLKTLGPGGSVYWSDPCTFHGKMNGETLKAEISGGCVEKAISLKMEKVRAKKDADAGGFFHKYASWSSWDCAQF